MATTSPVYRPLKSASTPAFPTVNTVVNKTVTFTIPAGLVFNTDTICLRGFIPKGCEITGAWAKSSTSQGTSTWALGINQLGTTSGGVYTTGSIQTGAAAFVGAVAVTNTSTMQKLTIAPGTNGVNSVAQADSDLNIVIGTANSVAATVTLTLQFTAVDVADSGTTYTL
jgi:hypothetical protein